MTFTPKVAIRNWFLPRSCGPAIGLVVFAFSQSALADAYNTVQGASCIVVDRTYHNNEKNVTRRGGAIISNASGIQVACPLVKTTSAPGIVQNDGLDVVVSVNKGTSPSASVSCALNVYYSYIDGSWNVDASVSAASSGPGTAKIPLDPHYGSPAGSWWENNYAWDYPDLVCTLSQGASITSIAVHEQGTVQPGYMIFSPSSCRPTATASYFYTDFWSPDLGGFIQAKQGGSRRDTPLQFSCPIPSNAGRYVQMSVGPSISSTDVLECSPNGSNWTVATINPGFTDWPSQNLPFFTFPAAGQRALTCKEAGFQGDGKIISYRTSPSPY